MRESANGGERLIKDKIKDFFKDFAFKESAYTKGLLIRVCLHDE